MELPVIAPYTPSKAKLDRTREIYTGLQHCLQLDNQRLPQFGGLSRIEYINEARKRSFNFLPVSDDELLENLANVFFGKSRNKRNQIAAFGAAQRPRAEISVRNKGPKGAKSDKRLSQIIRNQYDFSMDLDNADETFLDFNIETIDVGTAFLYIGWDFRKVKVNITKSIDWATGKKTYEPEERTEADKCVSIIFPAENIHIPNFSQPDLQKQSEIYACEYMLRSEAEAIYGQYPDWEYVPLKQVFNGILSQDVFFPALWLDRVSDPYVEIVHRFKKATAVEPDHHDIAINGVLMTDLDNAIIYDHKGYPFVANIFEKLGSNFFWGMSMHMKVRGEVDSYIESTNLNIDRSRASSQVKYASSNETEIEQDSVGSFEIVKLDDTDNLRELRVEAPKPGDIQFRQELSLDIDEATVAKQFSGAITGVTATEIINARAQNIQNLGISLIYLYKAAKQQAKMIVENNLQFFFNKNLKDFKDFKMKEINVKTKSKAGGDLVQIIRVVGDDSQKPSAAEINEEKMRGVKVNYDENGNELGREVETDYDIVYITPQEIADIEYSIQIVPGSSLPETESLKKALALELAKTLESAALSQYTDFQKLFEIIVEAFGYTVDDLMKEMEPGGQEAVMGALAGMAPQGQPAPGAGIAAQLAGTQAPTAKQLVTQP